MALSVARVKLREKDTVDTEMVDSEVVEAARIELVSVVPWLMLIDGAPGPSAKAGTDPICFEVGFTEETPLDWVAEISAPAVDKEDPAAPTLERADGDCVSSKDEVCNDT